MAKKLVQPPITLMFISMGNATSSGLLAKKKKFGCSLPLLVWCLYSMLAAVDAVESSFLASAPTLPHWGNDIFMLLGLAG